VIVSIGEAAERELQEAAAFYLREAGTALGEAFLREFERSMHLLVEQPTLGASWRGSLRRLPLRRFPYNVLYEVRPGELRVIAVAHQRRRPGFWRRRA